VPPQGKRRRSNQSHWISSPAGWKISTVSRTLHRVTGLTVGPQAGRADLANQRRVAEWGTQGLHLVVQGTGPDVRIVTEALLQVGDELIQWTRCPGSRSPLM
jgi:hypothetical protein